MVPAGFYIPETEQKSVLDWLHINKRWDVRMSDTKEQICFRISTMYVQLRDSSWVCNILHMSFSIIHHENEASLRNLAGLLPQQVSNYQHVRSCCGYSWLRLAVDELILIEFCSLGPWSWFVDWVWGRQTAMLVWLQQTIILGLFPLIFSCTGLEITEKETELQPTAVVDWKSIHVTVVPHLSSEIT